MMKLQDILTPTLNLPHQGGGNPPVLDVKKFLKHHNNTWLQKSASVIARILKDQDSIKSPFEKGGFRGICQASRWHTTGLKCSKFDVKLISEDLLIKWRVVTAPRNFWPSLFSRRFGHR